MLKYIKEYRFYIILFIFILVPIISIDTATRSPRDYSIHDRVFSYITYPIQWGISKSLDSAVGFFQEYLYLWSTRENNAKVLRENRKLLRTIVDLRETQAENKRLRKLLSFSEKYVLETVLARVIAKDVSAEFRIIRINRGESDGIKKNMAVINNEGVVGRVLRTTAYTADVVTILDLLSSLDSVVKRSRARGIIEGLNDEICQLKFALRTDDIQPGDLLITSGLEGVFPKGVPVGTVSSVRRKKYGITQHVEVRPTVTFSKLEEVMVVTKKQNAPIHMVTTINLPKLAKIKSVPSSLPRNILPGIIQNPLSVTQPSGPTLVPPKVEGSE